MLRMVSCKEVALTIICLSTVVDLLALLLAAPDLLRGRALACLSGSAGVQRYAMHGVERTKNGRDDRSWGESMGCFANKQSAVGLARAIAFDFKPTAETRRRRDYAEKTEKEIMKRHGVPGLLPFSANPLCLCVSVVSVGFSKTITLVALPASFAPGMLSAKVRAVYDFPHTPENAG